MKRKRFTLEELAEEYKVRQTSLRKLIMTENVIINPDATISNSGFKKILPLIEADAKRLSSAEIGGKEIDYPGGRIRITKDDAISFLQKLPSNSVDLIVTDPAYSGMNNKLKLGTGRIVGNYKDRGSEGSKWFEEFEDSEENYMAFLEECRRVLKSTGHIYIMFDSYSLLTLGTLIREKFDVKNLITWDKVNIGMGHYFRRRHEFIIFATNGNTRKIRNRSFPDVWRFKRIPRAKYPTQKPVEVFQAMISASGGKGFSVCDPFMGSGSAAIAAIKNGCDFYGSDLSENAIAVSEERIREYVDFGTDPMQKKSSAIPGEPKFYE